LNCRRVPFVVIFHLAWYFYHLSEVSGSIRPLQS